MQPSQTHNPKQQPNKNLLTKLNLMKLEPCFGAFYAVQPVNGSGLLYSFRASIKQIVETVFGTITAIHVQVISA